MLYISAEDFLEKVNSISRITREEELACAKRMKNGDRDARERIIEGYLPVVAAHIRRLGSVKPSLTLIVYCHQALEKAVDSFDFEQTSETFVHRLSWYLRQASTSYIARRENEKEKIEILSGGREGKILKDGNSVVRPSNPWTKDVHLFLKYLLEHDFKNIPIPYGVNEDGKEVVSFVEGVVYNEKLPEFVLSDETLVAVAKRLREYHDIGATYIEKLSGKEEWMLPIQCPMEVMCHGDFAPYNTTFVDEKLGGMIDFDTVHPGSRVWDVAYTVYRWIPFVSPENEECYYDLEEQLRRLNLFADAYGLSENDRKTLPSMMVKRIESLIQYMKEQAELGNEDMAKNIAEGHMETYLRDVKYIKEKLVK